MRHNLAVTSLVSVAGMVLTSIFAARASAQTCTASATGLAFGSYQPTLGLASTTAATVTVTCNPGAVSLLVSYTVQLGTGGSGSFAARRMSGTTTPLAYQIYLDLLDTQVWGDGTGGTSTIAGGYLLGVMFPVTNTYPAYGRIPANQNASVGSYMDSVLVTLIY